MKKYLIITSILIASCTQEYKGINIYFTVTSYDEISNTGLVNGQDNLSFKIHPATAQYYAILKNVKESLLTKQVKCFKVKDVKNTALLTNVC